MQSLHTLQVIDENNNSVGAAQPSIFPPYPLPQEHNSDSVQDLRTYYHGYHMENPNYIELQNVNSPNYTSNSDWHKQVLQELKFLR